MMILNIWPKQRANVTRKKANSGEVEYRARVRRNKNKQAIERSNAAVAAARAATQKPMREANRKKVIANEKAIETVLSKAFKELKAKRRKERNRRWSKALEKAHKVSRQAGARALRRWQQVVATPGWANKGAMLAMSRQARNVERETGEPHHVDHIVPIISRLVCGLHCEQNMCVLPGVENMSKGNKRWPDMP